MAAKKKSDLWIPVLILVAGGFAVWWFLIRKPPARPGGETTLTGGPDDYSQLDSCSDDQIADSMNPSSPYEYSSLPEGTLMRRPKGQQVPWTAVCKQRVS